MEDFKGTKGKKGELKWVRSNMGFQVLTADSHYSICEAVGKRGQEEQFANAQLIAAAPELLDALQDVVRFCEDNDINIVLDYAKATISKALGKEEENV